MAKKENVSDIDLSNLNLDLSEDEPIVMQKETKEEQPKYWSRPVVQDNSNNLISCLSDEKIIVRYINRPNNNIQDHKHVLYGGMANSASRTFTVPMLRSGELVNVLTNQEKDFLEAYMGLDKNALSVYLKRDNYWSNKQVRLTKYDTHLDLSQPEDYIKYKILLSNKDYICQDLVTLRDKKRETYQFVIINDGEEIQQTNENLSILMEAFMKLGELSSNKQILKLIVETMSTRPISKDSKLEFIKAQAGEQVKANPKLFLSIAMDPYLKTKVLLSEALEYGIVRKRNDLYYLIATGEPLCEMGAESTLDVAAKYLNAPKRQEVKLTIEAKLKALKE
jgi:hypothetical protein